MVQFFKCPWDHAVNMLINTNYFLFFIFFLFIKEKIKSFWNIYKFSFHSYFLSLPNKINKKFTIFFSFFLIYIYILKNKNIQIHVYVKILNVKKLWSKKTKIYYIKRLISEGRVVSGYNKNIIIITLKLYFIHNYSFTTYVVAFWIGYNIIRVTKL